ncbi:glycosyltransferase family 2 protein [Thalassomonas haliotis]|uniref:Glycosyltransferase n=1 Tax=Thalassomonas haliotis TaxID=485448 RepID=A0ABY7VHT7_9GAMM|nr:glycosyltransferase [Thalassomonas haliotis]WDE13289.1 glycosyltransferase [Thalassomonas haliotis]
MNKTKPEISIIMATYNSAKYIEKSIESILNQTNSDWELVITDDSSTDDTFQILESYQSKYDNIHVLKNKVNSGAAVARNSSLNQAKGRFIAFLDSDDLWHENKLQRQIAFMKKSQSAMTFTSYEIIDEAGQATGKKVDINIPNKIDYRDLLSKKATFGCSTVIVDKNITGDFMMPLLRTGQDFATWLLILKKIDFALHFPEVLTSYRITPGSISRNKFSKAKRQWQIYRKIEQLGFLESSRHFVNYAIRAVLRK